MKYAKFWAAVVGGAATSAIAAFGADTTIGKIAVILSAMATAVAVYRVPNELDKE